MLDIAFVNETDEDVSIYEELITKVLNETTKHEKIDHFYEVSVVYVSKDRIQEMNRTYRNIDKVTDVISFALLDKTEEHVIIQDEDNITTLGDIFICLEKMKEQALEYGHSNTREIAFLACHGMLHLLGYDHDNLQDEKNMFQKQDEILNALNIKR